MQHASYELRISDWSSDVCPSDLRVIRDSFGGAVIERQAAGFAADPENFLELGDCHRRDFGGCNVAADRRKERKSVVKVKSVAIRVDIGGRSISKRKNIMSRSEDGLLKRRKKKNEKKGRQ